MNLDGLRLQRAVRAGRLDRRAGQPKISGFSHRFRRPQSAAVDSRLTWRMILSLRQSTSGAEDCFPEDKSHSLSVSLRSLRPFIPGQH